METSKIFRVSAWKVLSGNRRVTISSDHFSRRADAVEAFAAFEKPKGVRAQVRVVFTSADLRADGVVIYTMYVYECEIRVIP